MLQDNEIVIRPWERSDATRMAVLANNRKIFDRLRDGFPSPYEQRHAKVFIRNARKNGAPPRLFAITVNNELVGSIGIYLKDDIYKKNAEIG
ncbi:MAG: GNAT family N-acetyltransferase, partial [Bacteroidota bacterium]